MILTFLSFSAKSSALVHKFKSRKLTINTSCKTVTTSAILTKKEIEIYYYLYVILCMFNTVYMVDTCIRSLSHHFVFTYHGIKSQLSSMLLLSFFCPIHLAIFEIHLEILFLVPNLVFFLQATTTSPSI